MGSKEHDSLLCNNKTSEKNNYEGKFNTLRIISLKGNISSNEIDFFGQYVHISHSLSSLQGGSRNCITSITNASSFFF